MQQPDSTASINIERQMNQLKDMFTKYVSQEKLKTFGFIKTISFFTRNMR